MIISVTDRRQETQFLDRQTRKVPSTFGKALNVKDYGTRLWSRTSRNDTSVDFAKNIRVNQTTKVPEHSLRCNRFAPSLGRQSKYLTATKTDCK